MLNTIIRFSVKNKLIIGLFVLLLVGYGAYECTRLPIDAVPDITDNQVQVITSVPSLGAPDVERLITFPIEQATSNIPGLHEIRSFSRFGLSLITIVFDDNVDIYWARQQVSERLKSAQEQIPAGMGTSELAPVTTGLGEIYQYVLRAKHGYEMKYDETELRTIQDWIVRRQLLGVKGVADVSSFGGKLKQYEIAIDASKLKSFDITMNDVFVALEKNNENTGGAYIEKKSTVLYIRSEGLIGSMEDIRQIVVKNTDNGTPLLIKDVADVRIGSAVRYGGMTYNDEGEAAGGVVLMLKGGNSSQVIGNVKERIQQIEKTLPEGVVIEPFLDRTKMVNSALGTVATNLMEGALIVIFVLVLFLGNFRAGLLVASVIPLSMLFAVIMMNLFGVSGNLMSLGALDFGLIVDGAVIIVEAVLHSVTHNHQANSVITKLHQSEMDDTVNKSASRMMNSAVFGQIIILIVYLPIFTLEGIEGKMFKPMAQTVAFALLGAFLLSLTYIPMMSTIFLSKSVNPKRNISDKMMEIFIKNHVKYLTKILKFPKTVLGGALCLMLVAGIVFSGMGGEFIPELPEGDFAVETRVLTGSSIPTTVDACLKAAHILKNKFPEVEKVIGKVGSGEIPTDPMPMVAADLMIILKDKSEWTSADTWEELSGKMSEALLDVPGVTYSFQYPVAMRFNELMTGAKQDVVCKIFGENLDSLSKYGKMLGEVSAGVDGAENIYVEPIDGLPQLVITYKRNVIAQYGMNVADINRVVNTAFAGQSTGQVFEDEKRFDMVVRLAGERRKSVEDVQNLLIPTPRGEQIPLSHVAEVAIQESVNQIQREDAKRRIIVGFNVHRRDVQSIVNDLQDKVNKRIKLPAGYYITYGGAFENLVAAQKRLSLAVPLALLLIFLFLYFAFGSLRQGLLIYSAIPLSAVGGVFFLALRGMPFSISAGVGFIALFGVSVLNGIVLVAEFNRVKSTGELDPVRIVIEGTRNRLRPVLMTAFVASLGFLPMALSHGAGAEVQRPLATVVIGGLLIATFLTLFVLPVLYTIFEKGFRATPRSITASIFFVMSMLTALPSTAQQPISLQAAIDTALRNNLSIKNESLQAEYLKKLTGTTLNIPSMAITGEYGQMNSAFNDTKFSLSQTINFPTVYIKSKALSEEKYRSGILALAAKQAEIKQRVREVYYGLLYLQQKENLLQRSDSMYAALEEKSRARLSSGESTIIEQKLAEMQRGQVRAQLLGLQSEMDVLLLQFHVLLNTQVPPVPLAGTVTFEPHALDSSALAEHPRLRVLLLEKNAALLATEVEQSKLLPDLTVGFSSQTIQGTGADDIRYSTATRFNSFQVGVSVPLFFGAQSGRIDAARTMEAMAENSYTMGKQTMNAEFVSTLRRYKMQKQVIEYYENTALGKAKVITQTADLQLSSGEINYLEWAQIVNTAVALESSYLDAVKDLNETSIHLEFLTNN